MGIQDTSPQLQACAEPKLLDFVNAALGVSFHIFKIWEAADLVKILGMDQAGYLHSASQGWPPWAYENWQAVKLEPSSGWR